MSATEVRRQILDEHAELRELLDEVATLAEGFEKGGPELGRELRGRGLGLYAKFAKHLASEDAILVPALRATGDAGANRAERLTREHEEQRELLKYLIGRLAEQNNPTILVARELRNFVEYVRYDMAHEEETMLTEDVLRDQGIAREQ